MALLYEKSGAIALALLGLIASRLIGRKLWNYIPDKILGFL